MKQGISYRNKKLNYIIASALGIIICLVYWFGGMRRYENTFSDSIITALTVPGKGSPEIVLALTSQRCLKEAELYYNMGWPWNRAIYSKLVRFLKLSGARLIIDDSFYSNKSVFRTPSEYNEKKITRDDRIFSEAIESAGNVIIGYYCSRSSVGRSLALQARSRRFDPDRLH